MKLDLSCGTRITYKLSGWKAMFRLTENIFTDAVEFFADVCENEWQIIKEMSSRSAEVYAGAVTHMTKTRSNVKYPFDKQFPNFPSYLRQNAFSLAFGKVKSYHSNYEKRIAKR